MNNKTVYLMLLFAVLVIFQITIGKTLVLFNVAFCFLYVLFILQLPVDAKSTSVILYAFAIGVIMDTAYNTGGMHASASVLIGFLRASWLKSLTPQGGYELNAVPSLSIGGITWFLGYAFPLIFIHHTLLFFLESYGFSFFWTTWNKAFMSSIFTTLLCMLILILFKRKAEL